MLNNITEILQEEEGNRFKIEKYTVSKEDARIYNLALVTSQPISFISETLKYDVIQPGEYIRLFDKEKGQTVMSNTDEEIKTNEQFIALANGEVLIGGLGLGLILLEIQDKSTVSCITVIEKEKEVIDLVQPMLPLNSKVRIIHDDIFKFEPKITYDTIYFDIWNTLQSSNIYDINTLEKKYKPFLNTKNPYHHLSSWRKETYLKIKEIEEKNLSHITPNVKEAEEILKSRDLA